MSNGTSIFTSRNWIISEINFSKDCQNTAKFVAKVAKEADDISESNFAYAELITLLRSVSPVPFQNVSSGAIVDWANSNDLTNFYRATSQQTVKDKCKEQFCQEFQWEGNSDVAGIGIFVSYVLEIALATVFILAFAYYNLIRKRTYGSAFSIKMTPDSSPIWTALHASIGIFWDSALLFGGVINIAAVVAIATRNSAYAGVFIVVMAQISALVLIVTWPFYLPGCRYSRYRWLGLGIVCCLCVISLWYHALAKTEATTGFEANCFNAVNSDMFRSLWEGTEARLVVQLTTAGLLLLTCLLALVQWFYECFVAPKQSLPAEPKEEEEESQSQEASSSNPKPDRQRRPGRFYSRLMDGLMAMGWLVAFVCMWMHLVDYAFLRIDVARKAGPSLKEDELSFGQILALATWLPTVLDFVVVWRGHLKSIVYRLPLGVELQSFTDEDSQEDTSQPAETPYIPVLPRATL